MSEKKKHSGSGSYYRKRKLQQSHEDEKQAAALKKFIRPTTGASTSTAVPKVSEKFVEVNLVSTDTELEILTKSPETSTIKVNGEPQSPLQTSQDSNDPENEETMILTHFEQIPEEDSILSHDPGEWPEHINDKDRQILVQRGPEQISNYEFPLNKDGRRFGVNNYRRRMCNGEDISRSWLIYSVMKDAIYCFCCRLFGKIRISLTSKSGYSDWKHMSELLSEHEKSPGHMKAYQDWVELSTRLHLSKTIDSENQRIIKNEIERWKEIFKRIVLIIEFLASQNLALRGKTDKLYSRDNGNFLKLTEFIGKFDLVMAEHLRRISSRETYVHYLGKTIQNEIIELFGSKIKDHILKEVQEWTYYSIIVDCTADVSHTEQLSLVIRYVSCESGKIPCIHEHFLGFIPTVCSTGEALVDILLTQLEAIKLPLKNMRGQGYDNAANMKGKHVGVQKMILDLNPRAFFVPCSSHSLNLVVNDAALSCREAVNFFSIIQEIYNFFSASTHRWSVLKEYVSSLTVKPLSETRWESRIDAVTPIRYQAGEIYDALYALSTNPRTDAFGKNTANGLARKIKSFRFTCCLVVWHTILFRINLVSKMLQKEEMDIAKAVEMIAKVKSHFESMRTDRGFEELLLDAREVAENLEIDPLFLSESDCESKVRPRKTKRQFEYEAPDEPIADPKMAFKSNFYFYVLDQAISSLAERFSQLNYHNDLFGFLYKMKDENKDKDYLKKKCADLQMALTDEGHCDIEGFQLQQELLVLLSLLPDENAKTPLDILKYLTSNHLTENFPNVSIALRIALTLPVSVASGERSFSKLKLIKNYLRSNMCQERLVGLAMMSIEFDILQDIDMDVIVRDFADKKARKVLLSLSSNNRQ